jgi:hypothetical protein
MIMPTRWGQITTETQAARHSKMQQQKARVQIEQQILAPAAQRDHLFANQRLWVTPQRPPQWFTHTYRLDPGPSNSLRKAATGDFHFGQLRHAIAFETGLGAWIIMARWCNLIAFEQPFSLPLWRQQQLRDGHSPAMRNAPTPQKPQRYQRPARSWMQNFSMRYFWAS